jgi:hypothetical protein
MADTSDAFFNSFSGSSPAAKPVTQLNLKSTPLPPPPAAAGASTAGTSYYSAGTSSARPKTVRKGAPPLPPPKPSTNGANSAVPATRPMRSVPPASTATTTASTGTASSAGGGYYGASGYGAPAPASASATNSNPYYQSTAPAPVAPAASAGYQYASAPVPAYNYASPAPAAAATPVPQVINPYMLGNSGAPAGGGFSGSMDTGGLSGAMDTYASLSGPMDTSAPQQQIMMSQLSTFLPQASAALDGAPMDGSIGYNPIEFEGEPPLMEELGVNVEHIAGKMRSVVLPFQRFGGNMDATVIQDADLAGPIALALLLGGELVLSGKFSFGYIYGFGMFGCVTMTLVLNFMSPNEAVSFWTVTSILGYSLLPVNLLAAVKLVIVNVGNLTTIGRLLGILAVIWCTVASTRLMEQGCDMRNQRYLIAYPIGLIYTAFVMITIF